MGATLLGRVKQLFAETSTVGDDASTMSAMEDEAGAQDLDGQVEHINHLISQLGDQDSLVAGCVQLLGLDSIEARFGSQWKKIAGRALGIVEKVLRAELAAGDVYRQVGDAAFQICFAASDEALARAQLDRISAAIIDIMATELRESEKDLTVDTFVSRVPAASMREGPDPISSLHATLLKVRKSAEAAEQRRHSIPALRSAGALFQPLWSNRDFGVTQNRCVIDTRAGEAAAKHLEQIDSLEDLVEALANLDCVLFTKSVEGLHQALGEVKRATIVVPVHFQTLAAGQGEFMDLAATLPQAYRRIVLLDIIGVPVAAARSELSRALAVARNISDRTILQLAPTDHRLDEPLRRLVWGTSMSFGEIDSDDPFVARDLSRFALSAAEAGLYSFAYGANTIGKALAAASAGFDYIGGTAVHSTVAVPRPHGRFTPVFGENPQRSGQPDVESRRRSHPRFSPLNPNSTITLPNGVQQACRILNFSASGAAVSSNAQLAMGSYLALGSLPAQVVRLAKGSFGVKFLELQQLSMVEVALNHSAVGESLLANLRVLGS